MAIAIFGVLVAPIGGYLTLRASLLGGIALGLRALPTQSRTAFTLNLRSSLRTPETAFERRHRLKFNQQVNQLSILLHN